MLATYRFGPQTGTPLLIVHGLFGSARNWGVLAKRFAVRRPVLTVDMRNHGASFHAASNGYEDMAADLAEVIAAHGGVADILGHSMGGKAAMVLALSRAAMVRRLIVADIAPVAYGHTQLPLAEAMRDLDLTGIERRSEADAALRPRVSDDTTRAFLLQSLDLKSAPPRWRLNLDVLADEMPRILSWPEIAGRHDGPVLFITGGASDYVRPEHRPVIRTLFPRARFVKIPGAGHWLHAERPRDFGSAIETWLDAK
ncbi:MAG: alpha/beta fold hydrolase [Tropicimonas sp.]|uniref:alpha/beta fold hydrolase n=1 Tax=Tropicimonas sp. TaxID=2067044 RepID=UPI003A8A4DC9